MWPAGSLPYPLARYLRKGELERAEAADVDLCVGCGLCTYVCPSKIDLARILSRGQEEVERFKDANEALSAGMDRTQIDHCIVLACEAQGLKP